MTIFYEIIKALFFGLTVIVGLFHLRGKYVGLDSSLSQQLNEFLMPGYMLFCGLMLGYLIAHVWAGTQAEENSHTTGIYIKSFMIGILLGIGLAFAYISV